MIIERNGRVHPIEIKRTANPGSELIKAFEILDKGPLERGNGAILCTREHLTALDARDFVVPIWMI